jgi:hypothetical protein
MTELGRIALDLEGPRGPDVLHEIHVPAEWALSGVRIRVEVPRRLACAVCEGGGCDRCGRSGAFEVPDGEPLEFTLPSAGESSAGVRVRFPGLGAVGTEPAEARGQLVLSVRVGDQPSRGVAALRDEPVKATRADPALALRILTMVVLVTLLFVFLLWFSGWM